MHAYCRAELQQTGEELLSAFGLANGALEYIPPVSVDGITVKSATAKTQGMRPVSLLSDHTVQQGGILC